MRSLMVRTGVDNVLMKPVRGPPTADQKWIGN